MVIAYCENKCFDRIMEIMGNHDRQADQLTERQTGYTSKVKVFLVFKSEIANKLFLIFFFNAGGFYSQAVPLTPPVPQLVRYF